MFEFGDVVVFKFNYFDGDEYVIFYVILEIYVVLVVFFFLLICEIMMCSFKVWKGFY